MVSIINRYYLVMNTSAAVAPVLVPLRRLSQSLDRSSAVWVCTMYNKHPRPKHKHRAGTTRRRQLTGQQSDCCRVPSRAGSSSPGLPRTLSPCSSTLGTWSPGTAADWRRQMPCTGELTTSQSVFTIIVAGKQLP